MHGWMDGWMGGWMDGFKVYKFWLLGCTVRCKVFVRFTVLGR